MGLKPDHWIRKMAREHGMIEPYVDGKKREGKISYGVSSYGYDIRVADEFKIFTNVFSAVVDPKDFDPQSMVDFKGDVCIIPPNSFALARTVEYFRIPRKVLTVCLGKCLTGDTLVVDAETGDYLPLGDFVGRERPSTVALKDSRLVKREVQSHTRNGSQPVYLLTTRAGLKIKATQKHPFLTREGWKPLMNLQSGERIAAAGACPVFGQHELPEHEAVLLGLLLEKRGNLSQEPGRTSARRDPVVVEALEQATRTFGRQVEATGRISSLADESAQRGGRPVEEQVIAWLKSVGCWVQPSERRIPARVFRAEKAGAARFLQALFSAGGRVSPAKSGGSISLEYRTASRPVADDLHHLLLRFGIFAAIRSAQLKNGRQVNRVLVTGEEMINRFWQEIGSLPECKLEKALEEVMRQYETGVDRQLDFEPAQSVGQIYTHIDGPPPRPSPAPVALLGAHQSLAGSDGLAAQAVQAVELPAMASPGVIWDRVQSIEPAGIEQVYDLTVPGAENFLANGLIVHNSTYARCGIIVNVTPFEPEWEGFVTLEISNTTPLPAKIYANEGIAQVLFFEADEECEISYADKKGKYQKQQTIELPKL